MKKKILIIGNNGYLGSYLSLYLNKKNYFCRGIDINYFLNCKLYKEKNLITKKKNASKIKEIDIKKFDVVIMLAAFSNDPFRKLKPSKFYNPSEKYTLKIAKFCKKYKIKFIFPSSCSVYGYGNKIFNENSKLNPLTYYSKNKVSIEKKLLKIGNKNFKPIILRLATVFGVSSRMRFDIVLNMFCGMAISQKKIFLNSNGLSWRPNIHIIDVCKSIKYFIENDHIKHKNLIFNFEINENNKKVLDLANKVKNKIKKCKIHFLNKSGNSIFLDKKIQDGVDKRSYIVSFNKIKKLTPPLKLDYTLEKGIKKTIKDLKKIKLDKKKFTSIKFYRLQMYKKLFKNKSFN